MAGIAGSCIALPTTAQASIAGAQALLDATTSGRGCTTNFIGFGLGAESDVPGTVQDFSAADDQVTLGITAGAAYDPDYTTVPGELVWTEVVP